MDRSAAAPQGTPPHTIAARAAGPPPAQTESGLPFASTRFSISTRSSAPLLCMSYNNLRYDPHQFAGWRRGSGPVSALTGISFDDYVFMGTRIHKQSGERRLPTPEWALNDKMLREVIVTFLENRARIGTGPGTLRARLGRAMLALRCKKPYFECDLKNLNGYYRHRKRQSVKRPLQIEIEGLDTQIRIAENPALVCAIPYLYHRAKLDSVGVAEELGIKPPHVRMVLYRMNQIAKQLEKGTATKPPLPLPPPIKQTRGHSGVGFDYLVAYMLQRSGYSLREIATFLSITVPAARCRAKMVRKLFGETGRGHVRKFDLARAFELRKAGMSYSQIGKEFGVSLSAVHAALRRAEAREEALATV